MPAMFSTDFFTSLPVGPTTAPRRLPPKRPVLGAGPGTRGPRKSCTRIFQSVTESELQRYVNDGKYMESLVLLMELAGKGYTPEDDELCARLINGLFNYRNVSKVVQVIDIMETYGNPGPRSYSAAIRACVMAKETPVARRVFDRMVERGVLPEAFAYDFLIMGLVRNGELAEAGMFHEEMLRNGFEPNAVNYGHLIEAAVLRRGSHDALRLLEEMALSGMQPDEIIYVEIAKRLCKKGSPDLGLEVFGKIEGWGFRLKVPHYNAMISVLWNYLNQVSALQFTLEMLDKGIGPDLFTYRTLISCLCKDGFVNEAVSLLLDMDRTSFGPDDMCYNNVIGGLCKHHRVYDAIELLAVMVEKGCQPGQSTYVSLIQAVGLSGLKSEALHLANSLHSMEALSDHSFGCISKTYISLPASTNH